MEEEGTLLPHIYKAKYFPTITFFESKLGGNPSYAWRGIHETIPGIRKVSLCRVGNGGEIQEWSDVWIP